ncbi:DNA repair and recombination protein RadB [Candidatus Woesearchaeota archaeon]|nr:DNA repair and recombination protein RadB [Candidatus Woesearchaeota archaeon]
MEERIPTGSCALDRLLDGGIEKGVISTVFGPSGSGKTTFCLLSSLARLRQKERVFFIDTEGGFSISRLAQLESNYKEYLDHLILFKPTTFDKQEQIVNSLEKNIKTDVGLIVIDTIANLYRVEVTKKAEKTDTIRRLTNQLNVVSKIAREKNIPVLISNQVYSSFDKVDSVKMVGGDILNYSSKILIELQKFRNARKAIIRKHRSLPENEEVIFKIVENGFLECE